MNRLSRQFVFGAWLVVLAWPGLAQDSAVKERQRIQQERRAVESRYQEELRTCTQRFAVNACLDEARLRRREGLAPLRQQELILSDRERKLRAAARARDIERNRLAADARALAPPPVASSVRGRSPASPPAGVLPAVPARGAGSSAAPAAPTAAQKAAQRASEAAQRQREAQADRVRIRARIDQRESAGKKAAPLPLPAAQP